MPVIIESQINFRWLKAQAHHSIRYGNFNLKSGFTLITLFTPYMALKTRYWWQIEYSS